MSIMIFGFDIEIIIIFGILVLLAYFFLSRIVFNKKNFKTKRNLYSIIATLIVSPVLFYFGSIFLLFFWLSIPEFQQDFDQITWAEEKKNRYIMRDDLVKSRILEKKSKEDVIAILGKPDRGDSTDVWIYHMGASGAGFGWAFYHLNVSFENEKVENAAVIEVFD